MPGKQYKGILFAFSVIYHVNRSHSQAAIGLHFHKIPQVSFPAHTAVIYSKVDFEIFYEALEGASWGAASKASDRVEMLLIGCCIILQVLVTVGMTTIGGPLSLCQNNLAA